MSISTLSDDQIAAIDHAVRPLQVGDREPFIQAVRDRLCGQLVGPGSLHRALAAAQAEFLRAKPVFTHSPATTRYRVGRTR